MRTGSPLPRTRRHFLLGALALACSGGTLAGCMRRDTADAGGPIVFRHPKLFGDPAPLDAIIAAFERDAGIRVHREALPASSDEQHLFYAINLQARSADFDVLALDLVWMAEFARAGWLRDLSHLFGATEQADFFAGPLAAARWEGRVFALPWFADAGLLYYRKDLLEKAGVAPPSTWSDLAEATRIVAGRSPDIHGFVFQGKQYEGLVCSALEFIRGYGGDVPAGREPMAAAAGLAFMRQLVTAGIAPDYVTTLTEEPSRILFGRGRALFLRNWPYAWRLLERPESLVQGRVGVAPLPHASGHASSPTLGGWMLGVNAASARIAPAEHLAAYLASAPAQKALALAYGYSPPRRSLYRDAELGAAQPFMAWFADVLEQARPRPILPQYIALSLVLQSEFSATLAGRRAPDEALAAIDRAATALARR